LSGEQGKIQMFEVNKNPSVSDLRKFGLVMLIGLGVIGGLLFVLGRPEAPEAGRSWQQVLGIVLWVVGAAVLLLSLAAPTAARPVYVGWMTFAVTLGRIVTTILLTVMFFVLLPVFALIRLADPLRTKLGKADSYWEDHPPYEDTLERNLRPF
jgi:hypothetical protein